MPTGNLLLLTVQCERRTSEETVKKTTDDPRRFKNKHTSKNKDFQTHKKSNTSYLGVDDGAGDLLDVGQVSVLGHQDRLPGQADLDHEGHPSWCRGQ